MNQTTAQVGDHKPLGALRPSGQVVSNLSAVMRYDNRAVLVKMQQELGISEADAFLLFEDTKKFLYLVGINPHERLGPPAAVDQGWHVFLLFTQDYADFCQQYFGRFLHHKPHVDLGKTQPGTIPPKMATVLRHARAVFGDGLSINWSCGTILAGDTECSGSTNCGGNDAPCW